MKKCRLNYYWWLVRSRLCAAFGVAIIFTTLYVPSLQTSKFSNFIFVIGWLILLLGLADGFGFIQRKKVKDAILEHENAKKLSLRTKQPWEND